MTKSTDRAPAVYPPDVPGEKATLLVMSRRQALRFRGSAPYVVISIRSPGAPIARLRADPMRVARINLAFYDTTPEFEERCSDPIDTMNHDQAKRIATFVAKHWGSRTILIHCLAGISRSVGVAAGTLDALSLDAAAFEQWPYDPNPHVRKIVRAALLAAMPLHSPSSHGL
jgi:predicted protein tyrosine phosphatase